MAALSSDRVLIVEAMEGVKRRSIGVQATKIVYRGGMAAINTGGSHGKYLVPAADLTALFVVGAVELRGDNSAAGAADGDVAAFVLSDCCVKYNQTGTTITNAHIGTTVYAADDQTVTLSSGSYSVIAGVVFRVDDDGGVFVWHSAVGGLA